MRKQKIKLPFEVDPVFGNNSWETIRDVAKFITDNNLNQKKVLKAIGWKYGDTKSVTMCGEEMNVKMLKPLSHRAYKRALKEENNDTLIIYPYFLNFIIIKEPR